MTSFKYLLLTVLMSCGGQALAQQLRSPSDCEPHLERARTYEMSDDRRSQQEFQLAIRDGGKRCPEALFEYSQSLSRDLRFREAAKALQSYIKLTGAEDHAEDQKEVELFLETARLKQRVDEAKNPSLEDFVRLTRLVDGYGRRKNFDALPYAEQALKMYPDAVDSLLLLVDLLMPAQQDKDRLEQLLNRALALDPGHARVYSTRGWFYLFSRNRRVEAERDFRQALSLSNNRDAIAWKGLGYVLMFNGQKAEAVTAFRNYLNSSKGQGADSEIPQLIKQLEHSPGP